MHTQTGSQTEDTNKYTLSITSWDYSELLEVLSIVPENSRVGVRREGVLIPICKRKKDLHLTNGLLQNGLDLKLWHLWSRLILVATHWLLRLHLAQLGNVHHAQDHSTAAIALSSLVTCCLTVCSLTWHKLLHFWVVYSCTRNAHRSA